MAKSYVIDLNSTDDLDRVIRKCNTNFKALAAQKQQQDLVNMQDLEETAQYLDQEIDGLQDEIDVLAASERVFYGTSDTTAATQTKAVTCPEFTAGDIVAGTVLFVRFTYAQSYNGAPNLNVNSTGAHVVSCVGTTALPRYWWKAGEVVCFVYEGTRWLVSKGGYATTTYYGPTKLSSSVTSTSESLAATPKAVKTAYDLAAAAAPASSLAFTRVLSRNTAGEPDFVDLGLSVDNYNEIVVSDSVDQKIFAKIAMPSSFVTYTLAGGNQFKAKLEGDTLSLSLCPDASWHVYAR